MIAVSRKAVSLTLALALVLLCASFVAPVTSGTAQAAVTINRDRVKNVIYPTFGYPEIIKCGESMTIEFDPRDQDWSKPLPELDEFRVTATTTNAKYPLVETLQVNDYYIGFSTRWPEYAQALNPKAQIYLVDVTVPEDVPVHLYDLGVTALNNGSTVLTDAQPHAMQTVVDYKTQYNYAQLTDIHVWGPEAWYPGACNLQRNYRQENYSDTDGYGAIYYHKTIAQMNREKPDFIVYTGDYDFSQKWLYQENYGSFSQYRNTQWNGSYYEPWFEMDWFYQETMKLDVPVFMVLGNHDAYARYNLTNTKLEEDYEASWRDLFGPQYFSFDYGNNYHFTAIDTMDWTSIDRNLHWAIPNVILSPENWQGQVEGGGDAFATPWTQAREDAVNENNFIGQLQWLKNDLEAHSGASIRTVIMHHDPWRDDGDGNQFNDPGGQGDGRIAVIKLLRENNVQLVLSGHDHSDAVGSVTYEHDPTKYVNFVNTVCVMLHDAANVFSQDFTAMPDYPGYRLIHVNGAQVLNWNYMAPKWSWPVYQNTNVGGNTNYNNLSAPSVASVWSPADPGDAEDVTCQVTNHLTGYQYIPGGDYSGDLRGAFMEFPMPYLTGGYYYELTDTTSSSWFGDIFDNSETSPTHRMYQVYDDVLHDSSNTARLKKSTSPDVTPPTCGSFTITHPDDHSVDCTIQNNATDPESGVLDMKVWNDTDSEANAEWQRWENDTKWVLKNEAGTRYVHIKFRNRAMPGLVSGEYTATTSLVGPQPTISGVVPAPAQVGDRVTINGDNFGTFTPRDIVQFNGIKTPVAPLDWTDHAISCDVPVGANTGVVTVTNDGGGASRAFTVLPHIDYCYPDEGFNNGSVHVENLAGTGFSSGGAYPKVKLDDGPHEIRATNVHFVSPESVSCDFDITGAAVGMYDIVIENPDHSTDRQVQGFSVDYPPPELDAISPSVGLNNGAVSAELTGDYLRAGLRTFLVNGSTIIEGNPVQLVSPTRADCTFDLNGAATGKWTVMVQNDDGETATLNEGFTVEHPAPVVAAITPSSGFVNGSVQVTDLAGNYFRAGAAVKLVKSGQPDIVATDVTVVNANQITCNLDLRGLSGGAWDVVVANDDGKTGTMPGGFDARWASTHVDSITPDTGKPGDQVTISGSNFGTTLGSVLFGGAPVSDIVSWSDSQIKCRVPIGASGRSSVIVVAAGGPSNAADFVAFQPSWYLAEGSTAWGFSTYISVANPNDATATIDVTYNTSTGPVSGGSFTIKPTSQLTINPSGIVPNRDFSTKITCREGLSIACDRTMSWKDGVEGHSSVGVAGAAKTWYLPEGCSAYGFQTWLLVQNPNDAPAPCRITYMIEGEGPKVVTKTVPAASRATFNMADDVGAKNAAIQVDCDVPVIPERSMYRNNRREGSDSIGTTAPALDYYLAEGSTAWGFTTYVLVQNPNNDAAQVTLTYMTPGGPVVKDPVSVPGKWRLTVKANEQVPGTDTSVKVHADRPIIAERSMYWNNGTGEACHDSIGLAEAHQEFYLPDGQTSQGRQTWTLVQNPNAEDVTIEVTYMTDASGGNVTFDDVIPARSRKTYDMSRKIASGRASVKVVSKTANKKIMVERSMYWNDKGAGTESIGGYCN